MSATIDADVHVVEANKIFSRVLVGVDGTPESRDALRQAALLKAPGGDDHLPRGMEPRAAAGHAHDGDAVAGGRRPRGPQRR